MKFFYSAGTVGYGNDRLWHKLFSFPNLPRVTKTVTLLPKTGLPFAILKYKKSVWNRVGLHNCGINYWKDHLLRVGVILSIAGTDEEIVEIIYTIRNDLAFLSGIELNFSCPNVKSFKNKNIPYLKDIPIYLKLNHLQDPYNYNLDNITEIRLNSIPTKFGGLSGKVAQSHNWLFIAKFIKEGLNIAGSSIATLADIKVLEDIGCTNIGIGSIMLTDPKLVTNLNQWG